MIDILFAIIFIFAVIKGYSKGLIVAVFSFVAIFVGLAAALKLSSTVAGWLQSGTNITGFWLPFLSFALVMFGVILLVRLGARLVEKTIQFAMLGWVNKIGGILLYAILYTSLLSVCLFYFNKMHLIKQETFTSSTTYPFIEPFATKFINGISAIIPFFKDTFEKLSQFFGSIKPQ